MTEDEAVAWAEARLDGSAMARLHRFADMVAGENTRQNLVAPSTVRKIWSRHIVDSLQLLPFAERGGRWLDIGTGGGFPGMAIAAAGWTQMTLVEPRRRRVEFLRQAVAELNLDTVHVVGGKVERVEIEADVISARAVASVGYLLRASAHCAKSTTRWLLPRGAIDREEIAVAAERHHLMFHVEQSITEVESSIVVLEAR